MKSYSARVRVSIKPEVSDPEGDVICAALRNLEFNTVESVRTGKHFQIVVRAASLDDARSEVDGMCRKLLAHPLVENYQVELD